MLDGNTFGNKADRILEVNFINYKIFYYKRKIYRAKGPWSYFSYKKKTYYYVRDSECVTEVNKMEDIQKMT